MSFLTICKRDAVHHYLPEYGKSIWKRRKGKVVPPREKEKVLFKLCRKKRSSPSSFESG